MRPIFVVATANRHKFKEIQLILSKLPIELKSLRDFPSFPLPPETEKSYEENALQKAISASRQLGLPALADDSGLEIEGLQGQPGIYSSRFLGEDTPYETKNEHILKLMQDLPLEKRKAKFICAAAAAFPDGKTFVVRGEVYGFVSEAIRGKRGFGYDPIFYLPEYGKTMAQLSESKKNKISHRARAFSRLAENLLE